MSITLTLPPYSSPEQPIVQLDLTGYRALVCGASQDIGRASTIELAKPVADVIVLARTKNTLQKLYDTLPRNDPISNMPTVMWICTTRPLSTMPLSPRWHGHPLNILINNSYQRMHHA